MIWEEPESAEESFLGAVWVNSAADEWVAPKVSALELHARIGSDERKLWKLIDGLNKGTVRSYSSHAYVEWALDADKNFKNWAEFNRWVRTERQYGRGGAQAFHIPMRLPSGFWESEHKNDKAWSGWFTPFGTGTYADWKIGEFGAAYCRFGLGARDSEDPPVSDAVGYAMFYGVMFQQADIDAHFGSAETIEQVQRKSKYDWEKAISAFAAAQWKHDIVPDIHAYAAQAQIEKWISGWFATLDLSPSEKSVRARAQVLLAEMKRADKT